jgi:serine/threonine-protein kinase
MGEVYRARDTKLKRDVAFKVLPEVFASDTERMARFEREAQVLAALNHPNIAAIYGVEERAIVMELVEGETLAGPLLIETALDYARQIAVALEAAHEKGIIHRDLKPANVKITPDGMVKVLDFGLAKLSENQPSPSEVSNSPTLTISPTRAGFILGTAAYMAPEQARGAAVDKRADIWAFGVVLYEMLAARPAFAGETTSDILAAVLRSEPDWSALPAETPPRIRKLLRRCLERDRKQRLQDIGEARIAIDAPEEQVIARPATPRSHWMAWAAAGMLAIGSAVLAVALWRATQPVSHPLMRLTIELPPQTVLARGGSGAGPHLALSPDGRRLAVAVLGPDGKVRLATRLLEQSQFTTLTGTEGANSPVFSSDGQWIGFFADSKLRKIAVRGGVSLPLGDATPRARAGVTTAISSRQG